jgi:hypothetical protein
LAIKPWPINVTGRFGRDDFDVDHDARTATCPAGHTVTLTTANNATFDRHSHPRLIGSHLKASRAISCSDPWLPWAIESGMPSSSAAARRCSQAWVVEPN